MHTSPLPPQHNSILIVDDDLELRDMVADYLGRQGYQIRVASTARQMDVELSQQPVDMLLLDVVLPDEDGLSICRRINTDNGPAIMMMSGLSHEADRVIGLEFGADDYVCKPFGARELLARIRAVLRRRRVPSAQKLAEGAATFSGLIFEPKEGRILSEATGEVIVLTPQETLLLKKFVASPRRTLSRERLIDAQDDLDSVAGARSVDVRISRLRRKLQPYCGSAVIRAARGSGYVFDADVITS